MLASPPEASDREKGSSRTSNLGRKEVTGMIRTAWHHTRWAPLIFTMVALGFATAGVGAIYVLIAWYQQLSQVHQHYNGSFHLRSQDWRDMIYVA